MGSYSRPRRWVLSFLGLRLALLLLLLPLHEDKFGLCAESSSAKSLICPTGVTFEIFVQQVQKKGGAVGTLFPKRQVALLRLRHARSPRGFFAMVGD